MSGSTTTKPSVKPLVPRPAPQLREITAENQRDSTGEIWVLAVDRSDPQLPAIVSAVSRVLNARAVGRTAEADRVRQSLRRRSADEKPKYYDPAAE